MKIVVAVDGSPESLAAVEKLIAKLGIFRDVPDLTLLTVHPRIPYRSATNWVGKEAVERYYKEENDAALADSAALLTARGIAFRSEQRVGDPAEEIVKYATHEQCDVIVMGTHGHTALANLVMGSVATKVIATSKTPVLLMK